MNNLFSLLPFPVSQYDPSNYEDSNFSFSPKVNQSPSQPLNPFSSGLDDGNSDPFALLTSEDRSLAIKRGKQAYGSALLDAAFNGSWGALGTAFSKAGIAKQEVARKSQEESAKQRQDTLKFVQDNEQEKLDTALKKSALVETQRRAGILARQDELIGQMATNNPAVQQALTDYQSKIDSETDPDRKKALAIKLASGKQQIQIYSAMGTPEGFNEAMNVVGKMAEEVGSDAADRERVDMIEKESAARAGYGSDIGAFRKAKDEYLNALTNKAQRVPTGRSSTDSGIPQSAYANSIAKEKKNIDDALKLLLGTGSVGQKGYAAKALGIEFDPSKVYDSDTGELTPEFLSKVNSINPEILAKRNVDARNGASGLRVKGQDLSPGNGPTSVPDKYLQSPAWKILKAKGYSDSEAMNLIDRNGK